MKKKNILLIILIVALLTLSGISIFQNVRAKHHIATIELEDGRRIVVELYQDVAPKTVNNFINLAESGFYDGLTFHRVIEDALIQGGDPEGTGAGGSDATIVGEFYYNNEFKNYLSHKAGTISMARSSEYDSASSQFFITCADCPQYDGKYAAFGRVLEGVDIVKELSNLEVITEVTKQEDGTEKSKKTDKPVNVPVIKTITIQKYAKEYKLDNKYDKDEMQAKFEEDENTFSLEDYYNMLESYGYTINEDGTITSPSGETTSLFSAEEDTTVEEKEVIVE